MSQIEHSIGFYLLESYRLNKDMLKLREQKRYVRTPIEHFCILYKMAKTSSEIQEIQEQISLSNAKKEIENAEQKAFFAYNIRRKVSHLSDKICKQK